MTTFKKGDLIKCINTEDHSGITEGKKYLVISIEDDFVCITDDHLWTGFPYDLECFELSHIEVGDYFRDKKDGNIHLCKCVVPTSIGNKLYTTHNTAFLDWQVEPYVWHGGFKEGDLVEIIHNGSMASKSYEEIYHSGDYAYIKSVGNFDVQLESLDGFSGASYMKEPCLKLVYRRDKTTIKNNSYQERFSSFSEYDEAQDILNILEDLPTETIEKYLELRREEVEIQAKRVKAKLNITFADNDLKDIHNEMKELFK